MQNDFTALKHQSTFFANTGFIENRGQLNDENGQPVLSVLMYCRKNNFQIFVTDKGFSYVFHKTKNGIDSLLKVDENFLGAKFNRENIDWIESKNKSKLSFYNQNYPKGIFDLLEYSKLRIRDIYNGVDLILELTDSSFKYSFDVAANADEKQIKLQWIGANPMLSKACSILKTVTRFGELSEKNLIALQQNNFLTTSFNRENDVVSYKIEGRNPSLPLVIDPLIVWTSMFGGVNNDCAKSVTIDSVNNFYLTGYTASFFFPLVNAGTYFSSLIQGNADIFVSQFSANLHLQWSTFYGGSNDDIADGIKTDRNGNVFITGYTKSKNFPTQLQTSTYSQSVLNQSIAFNNTDVFLIKFNSVGTRIFSTFFGGNQNDVGHDIAINSNGNVYLIGKTFSNNFPTQNLGSSFFQSGLNGTQDAFVAEFTNNGGLVWSSYFGGNGLEEGNSISIDNANNIFIAGASTDSTQFPLHNNGSYFHNHTDMMEAFVAKFSSNNILQWGTFYGGNNDDEAIATVLDNNGNLYVAGNTSSNNFSTYATNALAFKDSVLNNSTSSIDADVFLLKFSNNGNRLWATLLGGSKNDAIESLIHYNTYFDDYINDALITDNCDNVIFSFTTYSSDLIVKQEGCNGYFDNNLSGQTDAAIARFSKYGELKWLTYYGGSVDETGMAMVMDKQSNILSAMNTDNGLGYHYQSNSPNGYIQVASYNSSVNQDVVLNKFQPVHFNANVTYSKCQAGCTGNAQAVVNSSCPLSSFQYNWSNGATSAMVNNLCTGNYSVIITDTAFSCVADTVHFNLQHGIQAYPQFSPRICSHLCNGTAFVQIPGLTNFTTTWYTPDTIIYFSNPVSTLCAGNDTVIVNAPGCGSDTSIFTVGIFPPLGIYLNALYPNSLLPCPLTCNGLAQVVLTGGQQSPHCIWGNGVIGTSDSFLCAAHSYTVIATDSVCYTTSLQVQMPNPLVETYNVIVHQNNACLPVNDAAVTPIYFGSPTKILWSNGDTTATTDSLLPGNYTCIISDSCVSDTIHVSIAHVSPSTIALALTQIKYTCGCGNIIQCKVDTGIHPPFTYQWQDVTQHTIFDTTSNANISLLKNVCVGDSILIEVSDICGDTARASIIVDTVQFKFDITYPNSCKNNCNIKAQAYPNSNPQYAGIPPYTYNWSNGATGLSDTNLCNGQTYYAIGYDACGHRDSVSVTIQAHPTPLSINVYSSTSCPGTCNATAGVTVYSGMPPYRYLWSTGQTTNYISGLCAGSSYWCMIKDTCGDTLRKYFLISSPGPPTLTLTSSPTCPTFCNGTVSALPSGIPPFTYLWSNGDTTSYITNACATTTYSCTVFDQCNQTASASKTVAVAGAMGLSLNVTPSCKNGCNGSATSIAYGGVPPYQYKWNTGSTSNSIRNLCALSTYQCTAYDACGDSIIRSIIVPLNNSFSLTFQTSPICNKSCNGSILAMANGGVSPYKFFWSNGSTNPSITGICDSVYYTCRAVDNCNDTITKTIFLPAIPIFKDSFIISSLQCGFNCGAAAKAIVYSGLPPYGYTWGNGTTAQTNYNLCSDSSYYCVINDACQSDTAWLQIPHTVANPLSATYSIGNPICANSCNGTAAINPVGGFLPLGYYWSNSAITPTVNNLCANNFYYCSLVDVCGQQFNISFTMPAITQLATSLQLLSTTCDNSCHDLAQVNVSGGKPPYIYNWSNGDTTALDTTLCPGINYYKITDGCNIIDSVAFNIRRVILLQDFVDSTLATCPLTCNGSASISTVGGLPPYKYLWQTGDTINTIKNQCAGAVWCIVKDNCQHTDSIHVIIPTVKSIQLDSVITATTCVGNCTGAIILQISGGNNIYNYHWNTGDTTKSLSALCPGIYKVLITNQGCSNDSVIDTIQLVSSLNTNTQILSEAKCNKSCDAVAASTPSGINPPYNFIWNNNALQNDSINSQLCAGINFVKITDQTGCVVFDTVIISQPLLLTLDTSLTPAHCNKSDGEIVAIGKGGTPQYHYVWSNNIFIDSNKNIPSGNYNLIITDSNGCILNTAFSLTSTDAKVFVSHDTIVHIGNAVNLFAYGTQKYFWQPALSLSCDTCQQTLWNGTSQQTYCVIGTDKYGCTDTACVTIDLFNICGDLAAIKMPNAFTPNADGIDDTYKPIVELPDCYSEILFRIYNRWGQQLFQATDFNTAWDGTFNNIHQPIDTYVWYLKVKNYLGEEKMMKGDVILIR